MRRASGGPGKSTGSSPAPSSGRSEAPRRPQACTRIDPATLSIATLPPAEAGSVRSITFAPAVGATASRTARRAAFMSASFAAGEIDGLLQQPDLGAVRVRQRALQLTVAGGGAQGG